MQCAICNERFKKEEGILWEKKETLITSDGIVTTPIRKEICNKCKPKIESLPTCTVCGELMGFDKIPVGGSNTLKFDGYFNSWGLKLYDHFNVHGQEQNQIYVKLVMKCLNYRCDAWSTKVPFDQKSEFAKNYKHRLLTSGLYQNKGRSMQ
jgi:hypothetical protein